MPSVGNRAAFKLKHYPSARKIDGKWLITQEHVSVPVDAQTGKPDLTSKP